MNAITQTIRHEAKLPFLEDFSQLQTEEGRRERESNIWPGVLMTATIAAASFALREAPGVSAFSPMILAIVI